MQIGVENSRAIDVYDSNNFKMGTLVFDVTDVIYRSFSGVNTTALIDIEDRNYNFHYGVSLRAIVRAFLIAIKSRRIKQGGSTIVQQLFRTLYPIQNRFLRKIVEISFSPFLLLILGRADVLNLYCKVAFFGKGIKGTAAASKVFFKKNANELNRLESLLIYSLLSRPNFWLKNPESLSRKVKCISDRLGENFKYLEILKMAKKISKNSVAFSGVPNYFPKMYSYLRPLRNNGDILRLSIDSDLQKAVYKRVYRQRKEVCIVVIDCKKFEYKAIVDLLGGNGCLYPTLYSPWVEVGSLLKPLLINLCVRKGYSPDKLKFLSKPITLSFKGMREWSVTNFKDVYRGEISLTDAVAFSDNSVCVQALKFLGEEMFYELLLSEGIISDLHSVTPSIVLGSHKGGVNIEALLKYYCQLSTLKTHDCIDLQKSTNYISQDPVETINEKVEVRKALKAALRYGTGKDIGGLRDAIGLKTGTSGQFQNVILFGRESLVWILHKEKENDILAEQEYMDQIKCFNVLSLCKAIWLDVSTILKGLLSPGDLHGEIKKWVA